MRVLAACSLGGAGHLNPLLPFLRAAADQGHETLLIGPPAIGELSSEAGIPFRAGGEPAEEAIAPIRERLPTTPPAEASVLGNRELFGRLAATAMLPAMERTCAEWGPDLVLRDPCEYASAVVAPRRGIPTAQVAISLAGAEWGSIDAAASALESYRRGVVDGVRSGPYLSRFPSSIDPSPFATTVRYRDPVTVGSPRLPDWWRTPEQPLVYVTFGTVLGYMTMAAGVYRAALEAVAGLDVRVLLTVGRKLDAASLGELPGNVHVEPWVDQSDILGESELVVCHGGSGTVLGALGAGIPLVLVPLFADQFENSRRVAGAGAGLAVQDRDPARIRDAIGTVLADGVYRNAARGIGEEMAQAAGVDEVLESLLAGPLGR